MIASRTLARFVACAFLHPAMKMSKHDAGLRSKKVVLDGKNEDGSVLFAVGTVIMGGGVDRCMLSTKEMMCYMEVGLVAGII
jgi:hypothetical protein